MQALAMMRERLKQERQTVISAMVQGAEDYPRYQHLVGRVVQIDAMTLHLDEIEQILLEE